LVTQASMPAMATVSPVATTSARDWDAASVSRAGKSDGAIDLLGEDVAEEKPDNMTDMAACRLRERRGDCTAPRTQAKDHGPIAECLTAECCPHRPSMTTAERLVSMVYTNAEKVPAGKYAGDAGAFHCPNKGFGVEKGDERADATGERR
jgi:hypothetical protein